MVKALADRLAEAFAEYIHLQARRDWFEPDADPALEDLHAERFRGIRPGARLPGQPGPQREAGAVRPARARSSSASGLTESFAMTPAAAVSGLIFAHPASRYFTVGRIGRDQIEDYAARRGLPLAEVERWLRPEPRLRPGLTGQCVYSDEMTVSLRAATAADTDAVASIWYSGGATVTSATCRRNSLPSAPRSRSGSGCRTDADTTVAVVGDEVAGFVMVVDDEVEQVYVSGGHRGSGVAGTLIAEAERQVRANGYDEAWLAVATGNARARRFTSAAAGPTAASSLSGDQRAGPFPCRATGTSRRSDHLEFALVAGTISSRDAHARPACRTNRARSAGR